MLEEERVIKGCIIGEAKWQRKLYEHFEKKMLVVCMRYTKSRMEAEDILQDGFVKVFNHIKDFRRECPLEQWIKRIMINTALKYIRGKQILNFVEEDTLISSNYATEENLQVSDYSFMELLKMIQELPAGYQTVFNLFAIEGYAHKEIAEMLGISEGTSKSQYARAKIALQEKIIKSEKIKIELSR